MATKNFGLVVHGGAGTMARDKMTPEVECAHCDGLQLALEDDPLFNAGKGAVFTSAGTHEFDAAIMDGKTLMAGISRICST